MAEGLRLPRDLPRLRDPRGDPALRRHGGLDHAVRARRLAVGIDVSLLHPAARVPARTRAGDAGYDLACVEAFTLAPGERAMVPTGVAVAIPPGFCGLVLPRSGLAHRHGISCVNSPGLVDPNYRGELRVILVNHGAEPFTAAAGDRIAQLVVVPFAAPELTVVDELPSGGDDRGANGFGSSGR